MSDRPGRTPMGAAVMFTFLAASGQLSEAIEASTALDRRFIHWPLFTATVMVGWLYFEVWER